MVTNRSIIALAALALATTLPAAAQREMNVRTHTIDGVNVIASSADNELISVVIGLDGGFASGETTNPALADFTADVAVSSGSGSMSKEEFRKFITQTSARINGSGDYRGITYTMTVPRRHFDRAWDVLASIITAPGFDSTSYRNIMQRRVADAQRRWSNPEGYASIIADSLVKLDHPTFGRSILQADIEKVTAPMMRDYLKRISERSRMLVVVVGNVKEADLKKKVAIFSSLPMGSYKPPVIPPIQAAQAPKVELIDRPSPTTYVQSSFAGPRASEEDYWPLQIGLFYLRNTLFQELRTKRNLTYAPGSSLSATLGHGRGVLSVSSTLPDSAIVIMYHELEKMKRGDIDETELNGAKQMFTTVFYMRQMTNEGLANALYASQRNAGDYRHAFTLDAINAVNRESVRRVFSRYARNLQVGVVGKKDLVTQEKYLFRE